VEMSEMNPSRHWVEVFSRFARGR